MDILKIKDWYRTPMGHMVRRTVQAYLNDYWPDLTGKKVLILGYGTPYAHLWIKETQVFSAMLGKMGSIHWPNDNKNRTCMVWESALPFTNETFDLILIAHGLEFADDEVKMLEESSRILKKDGRILCMVPNRSGPWCRREVSPLSRGRPYSQSQLNRALQKANLITNDTKFALFVPPSQQNWIQKRSATFEHFGRKIWAPLGGIIISEIQKDLYSGTVIRAEKTKTSHFVTSKLTPSRS